MFRAMLNEAPVTEWPKFASNTALDIKQISELPFEDPKKYNSTVISIIFSFCTKLFQTLYGYIFYLSKKEICAVHFEAFALL